MRVAIGMTPRLCRRELECAGSRDFNDRVAYLATDASTPGLVTVTIWRTSDGGATWATSSFKPFSHPAGPRCFGDAPPCPYRGTREVFDVVDAAHAFVSVSIAYGANLAFPQVFGTSDGGATWRAMPLPAGSGERLVLVQFATASAGLIGWGSASRRRRYMVGHRGRRRPLGPAEPSARHHVLAVGRVLGLAAVGHTRSRFHGWSSSAPGPFLFNRTNDGGNTWTTTTVRWFPS